MAVARARAWQAVTHLQHPFGAALVIATLAAGGARCAVAAPPDLRSAVVGEAEAALARGDAVAAAEGFERAALMRHGADSDIGLVRAAMQAGHYRRALALAAHAAGEHTESADAGALYAWLLRLGGNDDPARRVLAETLARFPDDPTAIAANRALSSALPAPEAKLLEPAHRVAPLAWLSLVPGQRRIPDDARVVASGVLVDDGRRALLPAHLVAPGQRLWARNGLGRSVEAELDRSNVPSGVVDSLRLSAPLDAGDDAARAERDPFAGSPGFVFEYADANASTPAWPWLRQGFFGRAAQMPLRRLGIDVTASRQGGPVLDAAGRLVGIALRGADGQALFLPVSAWPAVDAQRSRPSPAPAPNAAARAPERMSAEQAYERGLRLALQVIAAP